MQIIISNCHFWWLWRHVLFKAHFSQERAWKLETCWTDRANSSFQLETRLRENRTVRVGGKTGAQTRQIPAKLGRSWSPGAVRGNCHSTSLLSKRKDLQYIIENNTELALPKAPLLPRTQKTISYNNKVLGHRCSLPRSKLRQHSRGKIT